MSPAPLVARPGLSLAEAKRAYSEADTTEWLHGRNCRSVDCRKCTDLMDATNRAEAEVKRLAEGRVAV